MCWLQSSQAHGLDLPPPSAGSHSLTSTVEKSMKTRRRKCIGLKNWQGGTASSGSNNQDVKNHKKKEILIAFYRYIYIYSCVS